MIRRPPSSPLFPSTTLFRSLPRVYMAWLTSPIYTPGDADADITSGVLGGGKSSRLYKALVYDKQIAQDVSAQQQSLTHGSVFTIQVTARPGDRKSTRLNSSHLVISYAVFC